MKKLVLSIVASIVACCDIVVDTLTGKPTSVKAIKKNLEVQKVACAKIKAKNVKGISKLSHDAHDIINGADKALTKVNEAKQKLIDSAHAVAVIEKENIVGKKNRELWANMSKTHDLDVENISLSELEGKF